MRLFFCVTTLVLSLLAGCSSAEKRASELLDTARFEEKQTNIEHASRLYTEIMTRYPDTPAAKEAANRAAALKNRKSP